MVSLPLASAKYVRIESVGPAAQTDALELPARVIFREAAVSRVGTPMAGRVAKVHAEIGDAVRAGDPLVTIRSPDAASVRAQLKSTEEALRVAQLQADRAKTMFQQGVATERERVDAELAAARLEAEVARARITAQFVGGGKGGDIVIRAPLAGTVLARAVTVGSEVTPDGSALVELGDPNAVLVQADVFERDLSLVQVGAAASVALESRAEPFAGQVLSVGATVDPLLRTAPVRILLNAAATTVRPGMFGRATIRTGQPVLSVPSSAVLLRNGTDTVVYVATSDGSFVRRPVTVGHSIAGRVQVLSGLKPGERIVTQGALLLDAASDQLI